MRTVHTSERTSFIFRSLLIPLSFHIGTISSILFLTIPIRDLVQSDNSRATHVFLGFYLYIWSALSTPPMCILYRVTTAGQHTSFCVPSLHLVCPVYSTHVHVVQSDSSMATHVFLCSIFTSGLPCLLHPCACCTE